MNTKQAWRSIFVIWWLIASVLGVLAFAQAQAANTYQATPTSTHNRCRVIGIANVNSGVNLNVRPVPARTGTPLAVINGTANPQSIIDVRGDWLMLCSLDDKFISSDPALVSFVTVTPGPTFPTPTRLVTNTPSPTPSATLAPLGKRICIQYDNEQGLQDVCGLFPLNARVVSIEVVTEEP